MQEMYSLQRQLIYKTQPFILPMSKIQKLSILMMFIIFLQGGTAVFSQKITLAERDVPLEVVLTEIQQQTGYKIWYCNSSIAVNICVTIYIAEVSLEDALTTALNDQPLLFEKRDMYIVIKPKPNKKQGNQPELSDGTGEWKFSKNLLITILISIVFKAVVRIYRKNANNTDKPGQNMDVFDELISVARAENISKETRKKIIDLLLHDRKEITSKEMHDDEKLTRISAEAENCLKKGVLFFHGIELAESISDSLHD